MDVEDHWAAITSGVGHVAVEAARVEQFMAFLVMALLDSPRAATVIWGQNFTTNRQACEALVRQRIKETEADDGADDEPAAGTYAELLELLKMIDVLMTDRSHVMHALWFPPDAAGAYEAFLAKRWGRHKIGNWSGADLAKLALLLSSASERLAEHINRHTKPAATYAEEPAPEQ